MMYYRRKILLSLIEVFDGNLTRTDCEKLLFNFCKVTNKNHYDFFPHLYGPFSFVSYYDKSRLTELGLLKSTQNFQLNTNDSFLKELNSNDQKVLFELKASGLRGNRLVKKTYRENPQYTIRSEILEKLFDVDEIKQFQLAWVTDKTPLVFTLGYEGLTIDAFLNKLISNNMLAVVDVRNNPVSMKFGFSKKRFSDYINKSGMDYVHIPELGIPSSLRKGLGKNVSHEDLFGFYDKNILPNQNQSKKQLLDLISKYQRIALVCFETDYHFCHRHILIEHLKKQSELTREIKHI